MTDAKELEYIVKTRTDQQTGRPLRESWQLNTDRREFHRPDGGPTIRIWNGETGVLTTEEYHRFGVLDRVDGPALTRRDPKTAEVLTERWQHDHQLHRDGGAPAHWWKDPETKIIVGEEYWENGQRHRADGPAVIARDRETGEVTHEEYHVRGQQIFDRPSPPNVLDHDG
ncbi:hypothetical protein J3E64_001558 [Sphingobium sp. OAS761]|uniref:hypothetical protein n=1 Tax=Sphingobium sp. OAS761 TaxID=2817901 RepID=UPI0020A10A4A|nr:hypothetical protein [Sphingobium sp. OAS761]MCP1469876.1 hypothetical protein [Sphingobium sp. OAS761]